MPLPRSRPAARAKSSVRAQPQIQSVQIAFHPNIAGQMGSSLYIDLEWRLWAEYLAGAQIISRTFLDSIGPVDVNLSQTFLFPYSVPGTRKSAAHHLLL